MPSICSKLLSVDVLDGLWSVQTSEPSEPAACRSTICGATALVDDPKGHRNTQREDSAKAGSTSARYRANKAAKAKAKAQHLLKMEAKAKQHAAALAAAAKAFEAELAAIADPAARWAKAESYLDAARIAKPDSSRVSNRKRKLAAAQTLRGLKPTGPDGTVKARSFTVSICGKFARADRGGDLVIEASAIGSTTVKNAQFCGSTWTCPDCAQHVGITRATFVEKAIEALRSRGYRCVMNTTTVPHKTGETCAAVFDRLKTAQAKLESHGSYRKLRADRGYIGRIRVIEITHGASGWHVHSHDIEVYASTGETSAAQDHVWATDLQQAVYPIWNKIIFKLTGQRASEDHGFTVVPVWSANDYVAKLPEAAEQRQLENKLRKEAGKKEKQRWGAQAELTKAHVKKAEKGGRTPWDILDSVAKGVQPDADQIGRAHV